MKIKKQTKRAIVITGIFCILFLAVSIWYAVRYQNSRLVVPMDFSTYTFQTGDLPMILSVSMICLYGLSLAGWLCIRFWKVRKQRGSDYTRTLNPRLGYLGLLGFLGFGGFWTYALNGEIFPFLFFSFFGFFGFSMRAGYLIHLWMSGSRRRSFWQSERHTGSATASCFWDCCCSAAESFSET